MDLPKSIVKEFAKQAVEKKPTVDKPTQLVGTVQVEDGQTFVYLDGSNGSKTPVSETVAYQSGDRVLVSIQNRKATIIGNYTGPSINQALDNVIVEYALSSSSVSFIAWPGEKGEWNTIAPEKEDGSYMWQRTTKISTNPLINPEISLTCIQGSDGENGYTPYIGSNGNWWINGVDTGYSAEGDDGHSPYVDTTTNTWWEWDADIGNYHDTGIVPQGPGVFKSIVFKRFSSEPSTPTGGSYLSPVPSGWSDGIPSGTEQIWMSTRVFTSNGESPQTSEWTTPQMAGDTPDIGFEYSWIVTNPGNPTDNPDNWSNAATENSIWMAVRKKSMGVWSSWDINKIKGEDGEDGIGISSTVVSYAKSDDGNTAPTSGWENRIPPLTDSEPYLWTKTHIVYTSGSPAYTDIYTVSKKGETGADGYSPTVSTGTSSDGSTTITVTNKDGSTTTELVDGTARDGVDSLNDSVFGVQTFEYILDGVTIPVHKREDGTYYYILNDEEVDVAESDLVHDANGDLVSYQEGGVNESLNDIANDIDAIDTKVDGFNAREDALYKSIQDNSLIARKNARVTKNSIIITNDTTTDELLNYLQLNADSIMLYGEGDSIVTIAKDESNAGYMEMAGTSLLIAQESRLSTIRLRSADRIGSLALVAGSNGHVSLREVLD